MIVKCLSCGIVQEAPDGSKVVTCAVCGTKFVASVQANSTAEPQEQSPSQSTPDIGMLLQRGNMCLEDGEWSRAQIQFEKILDNDPSNGEAYLRLFMAKHKIPDLAKFERWYLKNDTSDNSIKRAKQFATSEMAEMFNRLERTRVEKAEAEKKNQLQVREAKLAEKRQREEEKIAKEKALVELWPQSRKIANRFKGLLAGGAGISLGVRRDGTVASNGLNIKIRNEIDSWFPVKAVFAYGKQIAAILQDGTVVTSGISLGAAATSKLNSQLPPDRWKDIVSIAIGSHQITGLKSDGSLVSYGSGTDELQLYGSSKYIAIASRGSSTIAVKEDHTVSTVGGLSDFFDFSEWTDIIDVCKGFSVTYGLCADGHVRSSSDAPTSKVSEWTNVVDIAAGYEHIVGLRSDGRVYIECNDEKHREEVAQWEGIIAVAAGDRHTLGLKSDGTVLCAGSIDVGAAHGEVSSMFGSSSNAASLLTGFAYELVSMGLDSSQSFGLYASDNSPLNKQICDELTAAALMPYLIPYWKLFDDSSMIDNEIQKARELETARYRLALISVRNECYEDLAELHSAVNSLKREHLNLSRRYDVCIDTISRLEPELSVAPQRGLINGAKRKMQQVEYNSRRNELEEIKVRLPEIESLIPQKESEYPDLIHNCGELADAINSLYDSYIPSEEYLRWFDDEPEGAEKLSDERRPALPGSKDDEVVEQTIGVDANVDDRASADDSASADDNASVAESTSADEGKSKNVNDGASADADADLAKTIFYANRISQCPPFASLIKYDALKSTLKENRNYFFKAFGKDMMSPNFIVEYSHPDYGENMVRPEQLAAMRKAFAPYDDNELVLAWIDPEPDASGQYGMLLTDSNLYYRLEGGESGALPLEEVDGVEAYRIDKQKSIIRVHTPQKAIDFMSFTKMKDDDAIKADVIDYLVNFALFEKYAPKSLHLGDMDEKSFANWFFSLLNSNKQEQLAMDRPGRVSQYAEKNNAAAPIPRNSQESQSQQNGCYITTAVCGCFNKPDDCYELTMFRRFRDNWLLKQADGMELIGEYYNTAPKIVECIDASPDATAIYRGIWDEYLLPCLASIEGGDFEGCKSQYTQMVNHLKAQFLS